MWLERQDPSIRSSDPGVMKFTSLLFIRIILCVSDPCEKVEKIFFLEKYINITLFNQRLPALWVGGVIKFTLYFLLTLEMLHIKFITDLLGSFKMKMLTHERRRMLHDGRRWKQPISIGHLSSNDSKKC